jgi:hypothetical protein
MSQNFEKKFDPFPLPLNSAHYALQNFFQQFVLDNL